MMIRKTLRNQRSCRNTRLLAEALESRNMMAVVIVDTLIDEVDGSLTNGDASLRDAIGLAAPNDSIEFHTSLNGGTIRLSLGALSITKSLTIDASQLASGVTIDASGNDPTPLVDNGDGSRVMEIDDQEETLAEVTLRGLTITGGDVTGRGGAILARESLTIRDSTISGNVAKNSAPGVDYEGDGGGIWARTTTGSIIIEDSSIVDNQGDDDGGGLNLLTETGTIRISRSTISRNIARGEDPIGPNIGGGVRLFAQLNGSVIIEESEISDNQGEGTAFAGGGIAFQGSGNLVFEKLAVLRNTGPVEGGGIHAIISDGLLRLSDSTIDSNTAQNSGGGLNLRTATGAIRVERTVVTGNSILGVGNLSHGAGIRVSANAGGSATIADSTIRENNGDAESSAGSGIGFLGTGQLSIQNSTVSGNTGSDFGGGVLAIASPTEISNSRIENNTARIGGGIYADGALNINNSTIANNSASESGGGLSVQGETTIVNSTISGNSATLLGGGISSGRLTQTSIYLSTLQLNNTTISGNSTNNFAGGIFLVAADTPISSIRHSTITGNTADIDQDGYGSGGGLYLIEGSLDVHHTIIAGNSDNTGRSPDVRRPTDGIDGSPPVLSLRFNLIGDPGSEGDFGEAPIANPDENGNMIGGPINGTINPLLGPLANNGGSTATHALLPESPATDAGDPEFSPPPSYDQRGAPFTRVNESVIDIGAFEAQPSPADLNNDGNITCLDVDQLVGSIAVSDNNATYDLNDDGAVDHEDLDLWLQLAGLELTPDDGPIRRGDANLDGRVDGDDFSIWNNHRFTNTGAWCLGDFDANGQTDVSDFNIWLSNRFTAPVAAASPRATSNRLPRPPLAHTDAATPLPCLAAEVTDVVFASLPRTPLPQMAQPTYHHAVHPTPKRTRSLHTIVRRDELRLGKSTPDQSTLRSISERVGFAVRAGGTGLPNI